MPQRRINTPIPPWAFPWADFTPIVTWDTIPSVILQNLGRKRVSVGMIEFETVLVFEQEAVPPTEFDLDLLSIVPTGTGLLGILGSTNTGFSRQGCLDILVGASVGGNYIIESLDYVGMDLDSCDAYGTGAQLGVGSVGDPITVHCSGYFPVVIP